MNRYKKRGWFNESYRHSLAAKGIKSGRASSIIKPVNYNKQSDVHIKNYYTTSGVMRFKEFIDLEVNERKNYTRSEINNWMKKYNIDTSDWVIWVSPQKWVAWRYQELADYFDDTEYLKKQAEKHSDEIYKYTTKEGYIIPESDDGDDGYLFVLTAKRFDL